MTLKDFNNPLVNTTFDKNENRSVPIDNEFASDIVNHRICIINDILL